MILCILDLSAWLSYSVAALMIAAFAVMRNEEECWAKLLLLAAILIHTAVVFVRELGTEEKNNTE